ncbi:hypothetical protein LCGC14_3103200 [marine sediment metagenome]|uniref:Uncharacterized protein n=1 Tax=marine sediment metagenome TaxID=412755 RepID=A0A0F8W733_9ZZZZ
MAIKTLNLDAEWDFQSKHDPEKGKDGATVFRLGTLSNRLLSFLQDKATTFKGTNEENVEASIMNASLAIEIVKYGVRDIQNLPDADGNSIPFETQKQNVHGMEVKAVKSSILDVLPKVIVMEVADELQKRNELDEGEAKNSDG